MLDRFTVRIVPATELTDFAAFDAETRTIELSADARAEMLPIITRDAENLTPNLSRVPILAQVQ